MFKKLIPHIQAYVHSSFSWEIKRLMRRNMHILQEDCICVNCIHEKVALVFAGSAARKELPSFIGACLFHHHHSGRLLVPETQRRHLCQHRGRGGIGV